jgi:hypothetical protein
LYILGDDNANSLAIWGSDTITIQGVGTTVNNEEDAINFIAPEVRSIIINLGGGNDCIVLGDNTTDSDTQSLTIAGNLWIDLGFGNDTVGLENLSVGGTTTIRGEDNNTVDIDTTLGPDTSLRGNVTISLSRETGRGRNTVSVRRFEVGGSLRIATDIGNDTIGLVDGTIVGNLRIAAGSGKNTIGMVDINAHGNISSIRTGFDADKIQLDGSNFQRLLVLSGAGNDRVRLSDVAAAELSLTTSAGSDHVEIYDSTFTLRSSLNLGADIDVVYVLGCVFDRGLTASGGSSQDAFIGFLNNIGVIYLSQFEVTPFY